ncbi:MAG: hypothetical protein RL398_1996 [Planctomycetota bacterium]
MGMQRLARLVGYSLLLTACSSGPEWTSENDPYQGNKFGPLTTEMLRDGTLPVGYRLGDRARAATTQGERHPRGTRDPNPETFYVYGFGSGDTVECVQWVFPSNKTPSLELLAAAGIRLGAPIALGQARPRDWGRLSQSHAVDERFPVTLYATDRKDIHVQLNDWNRSIDAIVWCNNPTLLLKEDRREAVADPRAELEKALAASDWQTIEAWHKRLAHLTDGAYAALVATAGKALDDHRTEVNTPLLAQLDAIGAQHREAWAAADLDGKVELFATNRKNANELAWKLLQAKSPIPAEIDRLWAELIDAQDARSAGKDPITATGWYWRWAARSKLAASASIRSAWQACRTLDNPKTTYLAGLTARLHLAESNTYVLPLLGPTDATARQRLAAMATNEAAIATASGRPLAARWLERWLAKDLSALLVADGTPYPYLTQADVEAVYVPLTAYERDRAGLSLESRADRLLALDKAEQAIRERRRGQAKLAFFPLPPLTPLLLREVAGEFAAAADAAAAGGRFATAAQRALQAAALGKTAVAATADLPALASATPPRFVGADAITHLLPVLAAVLPSIDANTAQGYRLCELLSEGEAAAWPLVRHFAVALQPDEVPALRGALGLPPRFAHLRREADGTSIRLVAQPQSSNPATDERLWQEYSGWSKETVDEGSWIRQEGAWISKEKPVVDEMRTSQETVTQAINADIAALDREFKEHNATRDRLDRTNGAAVAEFNRKLNALKARQDAIDRRINAHKPNQAAWKTRVDALNVRIAEYNRRLGLLNERRMREGAAGANKLDALLWPTLKQAIADGVAEYVAGLEAKIGDPGLREQEARAVRWLFGIEPYGPALWNPPFGAGYARIMADAADRSGRRQSTNDAYADRVADFCAWSMLAPEEGDAARFRAHAMEFTRFRDGNVLRAAINRNARLTAAQRLPWLKILDEVKAEVFGNK